MYSTQLNHKVAWVTPVVGVDGKLLYWERLYNEFSAIFKEIRVFTLEFSGHWNIPNIHLEKCGSYRRLYSNERHVNTIKEGYTSGISLSPPYIIKRLIKYKPDLIIANEFGLFTIYALIYARIIRRTPFLLMVEARPRFTDTFLLRHMRNIIRRFMSNLADAIITNNRDGYKYLAEDLRANANKIVAKTYLVANLAEDSPPKNKIRNDIVKFIYVGGLTARKGLTYAIEAFSKLLPEYNDQFIFEIIGDGPNKEALQEQVDKLGLSSHVIFHGRQNYSDIYKFYAQCDVLVFPTLGDYRALVTFEALSSGLAIIGSKYDGGSYETVQEGLNGYMINPTHIDEFSDKLSNFIKHPELIKPYSEESIKIARKYSYESACTALLEASNLAFARLNKS